MAGPKDDIEGDRPEVSNEVLALMVENVRLRTEQNAGQISGLYDRLRQGENHIIHAGDVGIAALVFGAYLNTFLLLVSAVSSFIGILLITLHIMHII